MLRAAGLRDLVGQDLGDAATRVVGGNRDAETGVLALGETMRAARALASDLGRAMRNLPGQRPLVVGGDCSILLGIFPALRARGYPIGLWFLDGHPDYQDGRTSDTGETADMELAVLTGDGAVPLVTLGGTPPMVRASDVVLLGHRTEELDADAAAEVARLPPELQQIDAATIMRDSSAAGQQAGALLAGLQRGVWLHLDLDVLDAESLPAVTYPQGAGLDWSQLTAVLESLAQSPQLIGVSVADFRPDLDPTGELAARIVHLLETALS